MIIFRNCSASLRNYFVKGTSYRNNEGDCQQYLMPGRTVGGRVLTPDGRGLLNATVSITDSLGVRRTVTIGSFGFYSFDNIAAGQAYTIAVSSRLYRFASRAVQVDDNLSDVDIVGME